MGLTLCYRLGFDVARLTFGLHRAPLFARYHESIGQYIYHFRRYSSRQMELNVEETIRVECQECLYSEVVEPDDELSPGEAVIEHGRETGHKLHVEPSDE